LSDGWRADEPGERIKSAAMVRLTRSFSVFAQMLSLESKNAEDMLQLLQNANEDLRLAATLFEEAGLEEEATYARSFLELSRVKFYEEHARRQLLTYNNEKAMKYFRNAMTSSDTAMKMLLQASFSRLLDRDHTNGTIRNLERRSAASSERITSLEKSLAKANDDLALYKKQLSSLGPDRGVIQDVKAFAYTTGRSLRFAKLSFVMIAILIVLYFGLVVTSSLHITSFFDTALLLSAAWAASTVFLILKETRRLPALRPNQPRVN